MNNGRIEERGNHLELLALRGRYHGMWQEQTNAAKRGRDGRENGSGKREGMGKGTG